MPARKESAAGGLWSRAQGGGLVAKKRDTVPGEDLQRTFGQNFQKARLEAGLSQSEASRLSGVSQSNISLLERGQFNASIRTMAALARVVGQSVADLLTLPGSKKR